MARAKKAKVLEEAELLGRCEEAFARVGGSSMGWGEWVKLRAAEEAIAAALDVGRVESARAMAEALPERLRGLAVVRVAEHTGEGLAEAKRAAIEAVEAADEYTEAELAGRLMASGDEELDAPARAMVEEVFEGRRPRGHLIAIVDRLRRSGREEEVRALLERWRGDDAEELCAHMGDSFKTSGYLAHFCDRPEVAMSLLKELDDHGRQNALGDEGLERIGASWEVPLIEEFMSEYNWRWGTLAEPMKRAGRGEQYARFVFAALEHRAQRWQGFEASLLNTLGASAMDQARAYMNDGDEHDTGRFGWVLMKVRVGEATIAQACDELVGRRKPDESVMSVIHDLLMLVSDTLEWGVEASAYDPVWVAIDGLFAAPFRTNYDEGVEHHKRSLRSDVLVRLHLREGDDAAVEAELIQNLADLKALHGYCKDAYSRNSATSSLVDRALEGGHPEIALKAARKISKRSRPECAARVAAGFAATDPVGALKALDSLAGKDNPAGVLIRDSRGASPALPERLWRALPPVAAT
jgi:hypothetical protein